MSDEETTRRLQYGATIFIVTFNSVEQKKMQELLRIKSSLLW